MRLPLWRRLTLAALSLSVAALLFHGEVAQALVVRGDDALRNGDRAAGIRYYARALRIDGASVVAADRLAFYLAMRRNGADARSAIAVADRALARSNEDSALLEDRALAYEVLHDWRAAERDFARAAASSNDARYDHLAGRAAVAAGDRAAAALHFHQALVRDSHFSPARAALASLR